MLDLIIPERGKYRTVIEIPALDVTAAEDLDQTCEPLELFIGFERIEHVVHALFVFAEFFETVFFPVFVGFYIYDCRYC
jgi:hypothetical protein